MKHARGVALVGVLLVLTLLSVLAVGAAAQWRADARLVANVLAFAAADHAAEAGVQRGLYELAAPYSEARWPTDGTVQEMRFGEARVRVAMTDEAGKIDLNLAPAAVLERLFAVAVTPAEARSLVERLQERRAAAPFVHVEELRDLPGISVELYAAVKPALTVHARQPGIIADAASRQVLLAIPGADEHDVERYLALRDQHREAGLGPPLPPGERVYFARNGNATFTVHAHARLSSGLQAHLAATVDLRRPDTGGPFRVLEWRHEGPELF